MLQRFQGQSLSEYSLAIALVGIVSAGGLGLLGNNINQSIASLLTPKALSAPLTAVVSSPSPTPASAMSPLAQPEETPTALTPVLAASEMLSLQQYPSSLENSIDTTGANGTTSQLLAVLDTTIMQALGNKQITQEQANALMAMSQKGHYIGNVEGKLEDLIASGGANALKQSVTFEGKSYSNALDLAVTIGTSNANLGSESGAFEGLYNQAKSQGALNDPTINTIITTLKNQILNVANGMQDATASVKSGGNNASNYRQTVINQLDERDQALGVNTQKSLLEQGVAVVTHNNATSICLTGSSNGTECNKVN